MDTTIQAATLLAGLNVVFLLALTVVWVRNYRTFQTTLILGLVAFAVVMLIENAVAIYYFLDVRMLYSGDPGVQQAVLVLRGLQFLAIAALTWVTAK
ncbi:MAG: hypothetical protein ABEJ57_06540 [Halobacteriaceae archaeon]